MWLEHKFKEYKVWCYGYYGSAESDGILTAIKIVKYKNKNNYDGYIFAQEPFFHHKYKVSELDLDIIKLKCMVIAKDLGWNIKSLT